MAQNVREQCLCVCVCVCVCVCLIRDFLAFLKPYQLADMLIRNPLNTVIVSCLCGGHGARGRAKGKRQCRVDVATFYQACSRLIRGHGSRKGEEEGAKLRRYTCGFARSADGNSTS